MKRLKMESAIRIIAGTIILTSLLCAIFISKWCLLLNVFVAVNLIQSAFTGFCPAELFLVKLGLDES